METSAWKKFLKARNRFRKITDELDRCLPELKNIQQKFADSRYLQQDSKRGNARYIVETPVVYNSALDDITNNDTIKLILVADNPGRKEQAKENRRYLTGPSGKIAKRFFTDNPALGIDFIRNVIILNKTPVHSPRTADLKMLYAVDKYGAQIKNGVEKSQIQMADLLLEFHEALLCPVWITGYSEMKSGGIFEIYTERLKEIYKTREDLFNQIYIYRHFSMNQFTIDLKTQAVDTEKTASSLKRIGKAYRERFLG